MRGAFILAGSSLVFAAVVACASSDDNDGAFAPDQDSGGSLPPEHEAGEGDAGQVVTDAAPVDRRCSAAGWCTTSLPGTDLVLKDVRPFENVVFAIAESPTLGVKLLEWASDRDGEGVADAGDAGGSSWQYIDDNSQNQ